MAEQVVSDLIMKFVDQDNNAIKGETITELNLRETQLSTGFVVGQMFEIQSFTFKTGLIGDGQDEAAQKMANNTDALRKGVEANLRAQAKATGAQYTDIKMPKEVSFKAFRENPSKNTKYPVDMKPFEFTRAIDISSPTLLDFCIKRKIFKSASLIKRKAAGGPASGEVFLRFDFQTVLIKSVDWDNDEPIKETCEFVCRAVTINYLPQLPDGTLGASKHAFWTAVKDLKEKPLS